MAASSSPHRQRRSPANRLPEERTPSSRPSDAAPPPASPPGVRSAAPTSPTSGTEGFPALPSWLGGTLALLALCLVLYIPAMNSGYIWDDDRFLTENPLIEASDGPRRFWFSTESFDYWPLTSTMLWIEWRLWEGHPGGFHAVNVLLHAFACVLIWRILRRLGVPGAFACALLYAVHPVNVETVAWITQRKNTLSQALHFLALLWFLRSEDDAERSRRYYGLSLLAFLGALLSKTSVVMLPVVLLGLAWFRRGRIGRADLLRSVPFFALAGALALLTIWFQYNINIGDHEVRSDTFASRTALAAWAVWFYVSKALLPVNLCFVYPMWEVDVRSILPWVPFAALVAFLAVLLWKRHAPAARALLVGGGYYVVSLFPVLGFFDIYYMRYSLVADHYQSLALPGLLAVVVAGCVALARRWAVPPRHGRVAAGVLFALLFVLSWREQAAFKDEGTMWEHTLEKNPSAWMAWNNLGLLRLKEGDVQRAAECFLEATRINPQQPEARSNLGNLLLDRGRHAEAMQLYHEVLEDHPGHAKTHFALGKALHAVGESEKAIARYHKALELLPRFPSAYNNLGSTFFDLGRFEEALEAYRTALELQPDFAEARGNYANLLARLGQLDEAMRHYDLALQREPANIIVRYNMANALDIQGKHRESIAQYRLILRLDPNIPEVHRNLADALRATGDPAGAVAHYRTALRLRPDWPEVQQHLHELDPRAD